MSILSLFALAAAAEWTVEADGRGDFETIGEAVAVAASGDTIIVGDGTFGGFVCDKELHIDSRNGAAFTTIDGAGTPAVTSMRMLTLSRLTVTSAGATALVMAGGGELVDLVVTASGGGAVAEGGGARFEGGSFELVGVNFSGNQAVVGGAVYASGRATVVEVRESSFAGNTADSGGAVALFDYADFDAESSTFADNVAAVDGGALYASDANDVLLAGNTWRDNLALGRGGAIYLAESAFYESADDRYLGNEAVAGGALAAIGNVTLTLSAATFDGNRAENGGAAWLEAGSLLASTTTTWSNNAVTASGGAVYAINLVTLDETGAIYTDNTAYGSGGAVYGYDHVTLTETSATFDDSTATYGYGGHVHLSNYGSTRFVDTTFSGGLAYYDGGAVYAYYLYDGGVSVERCRFDDNTANYGSGGALLVYQGSGLSILASELTRNRAYSHGGGLAVWYGVPTEIRDSVVRYNTTVYFSGGGINWNAYYASDADFMLTDSVVSDNAAAEGGGGLALFFAADVEIAGTAFERNIADDRSFGGGMLLSRPSGLVHVHNTGFEGNSAGFGGGMYVEGSRDLDAEDDWHNLVVAGNTARVGGGACFVRGISAHMRNVSIVGNAASSEAGGLCVSEMALELENTVIASTLSGAALHVYDAESLAGLALSYGNFAGNLGGDVGGELAVLPNSLAVAPGFVRWTDDGRVNDSFLLVADSPMRDAGDPDVTDLDGTRADIGAWGGPDVRVVDRDADGSGSDVDCDDADPAVGPGTPDPWYDGLDADCLGNDDQDQDADGSALAEDCDDADPTRAADCSVAGRADGDSDAAAAGTREGCGCETGRSASWLGLLALAAGLARRVPPAHRRLADSLSR
ncbi:MAG: hypothetical protein EXR71_16745 [Myxococcales bacterium]|nr:hypothetical protein [Myxococcales bacterium]